MRHMKPQTSTMLPVFPFDVLALRGPSETTTSHIVQRQNKWSILVSSDLRLLGEIINRGASLGKTMAGSSGIEPQG